METLLEAQMDRPKRLNLPVGLALLALLLSACGNTTVLSTPKAGRWQGPSASFEVTESGRIRGFRLEAHWGTSRCVIDLPEEIAVEIGRPFTATNLIAQEYYAFASRVTPIVAGAGPMVEAHRVTGVFGTATTVTGTFKVLVCGDQHFHWEKDYEIQTWSAEWQPLEGEAPVSTLPGALSSPLVIRPTPLTGPAEPSPSPQEGVIHLGGYVRVIASSGLALRQDPSLDGVVLQFLPSGTVLEVVGGPEHVSGYTWWQLRKLDDGQRGWAAAGTDQDPFLELSSAP